MDPKFRPYDSRRPSVLAGLAGAALLVLAGSLHADDGSTIYRHVDADGNITYSNEPLNDTAEKMDLPPISVVEIDVLATGAEQGAIPADVMATATEQIDLVNYEFLRFETPQDQATIPGHMDQVLVRLRSQPSLAPGHSVRYSLDGKTVATLPTLSFVYEGVIRGQHVLSAAITDANGSVVETAQPITIYRVKSSINQQGALDMPTMPTLNADRIGGPLSGNNR